MTGRAGAAAICRECHAEIGKIVRNPAGQLEERVHYIAPNCKHPPPQVCPAAQAAITRARSGQRLNHKGLHYPSAIAERLSETGNMTFGPAQAIRQSLVATLL